MKFQFFGVVVESDFVAGLMKKNVWWFCGVQDKGTFGWQTKHQEMICGSFLREANSCGRI